MNANKIAEVAAQLGLLATGRAAWLPSPFMHPALCWKPLTPTS